MLNRHEAVRKIFHVSSIIFIFVNEFLGREATSLILFLLMLAYAFSELLRLNKISFPLLSDITDYCAYGKEKRDFIISPFLFFLSLFLMITIFNRIPAYIGIIALSLGDSFAMIVGKIFGKTKLPYNKIKTVEGFLACFTATTLGSIFFVNPSIAVLVSLIVSFIESISNEAGDNISIPLVSAILVSFMM